MTSTPHPSVTIIVPCFRQAHMLPTALDSALNQTYSEVEVILINDGSDDHTPEVASAYEGRIKYISKANGGLGSARNAGIATASGDYLLFLDADDALDVQAIAWLVAAIGGRTDCIALMGTSLFHSQPGDLHQYFLPDSNTHLLPQLIHQNFGPPHCFLVPRHQVLAVHGFDESIRACEDWDLWCRLAIRGLGLASVREAGAHYRRYPGSMSSNAMRMLSTRAEVLLRLHEQIVSRVEFFERYGTDLLEAEHRVLRRVRVQLKETALAMRLTEGIEQLLRFGVCRPTSLPRRSLEAILGYRLVERYALQLLKLFQPGSVENYRHGYD